MFLFSCVAFVLLYTGSVPRFWLHDDGKERNEKCEDCHRRFASKSGLYKHRKLFHSNAPLIECEICGKRFGFMSYYKAHLFTHTENRPYKCEVCGKKYKHMEAFSRHKCVD